MPERMSRTELNVLLDTLMGESSGLTGSTIAEQRAKAMEYYLGEPFGNEVQDQSSYVSRDVQDTVEWIMPNLIEMFTAGDQIAEFSPQEVNDIPSAKQETDYINYVFQRQNNAFRLLHNWFKDGLLQKTGIVKYWWDESEEQVRETYQNVTEQELNVLLAQEGVELAEDTLEVEQTEAGSIIKEVAVLVTRKTNGKTKVMNIPPEEFIISRDATEIADSDFACHRPKKTISDLRKMGFPEGKIRAIITAQHSRSNVESDTAPEHLARFVEDETDPEEAVATERTDEAMMKVEVEECYIRVDFDGDGIAELRQVMRVGQIILINDEIDAMPFAVLSPILMPHKFHGRSVADLVMDIQLLKSNLMRSMLNNINLNNNGKFAVVSGMVNIDDMLASRPMNIVREKVANSVRRLDNPQLPPEAFQMLGYVDGVREERAGVSKVTQGIDKNALASNTASSAIAQVMSAAQQRIQMIGRVFAETGVKDLMLGIHRLVLQNEKQEKIFAVTGIEFQPVKPQEWREREDMVITVGLGNGNKDQKMLHLTTLTQDVAMFSGMGIPVVSPTNAFNIVKEKLRLMGIKDGENFATDATAQLQAQADAAAQRPDPEQVKAQMEAQKMQVEVQKIQAENQIKQQELQIKQQELAAQQAKDATELRLKARELDIKEAELALKREELEVERQQGRGVKLGERER